MNTLFTRIRSRILETLIEFQRVTDHTFRRLTGRPTRRRSLIAPNLFLGGQYKHQGLHTLQAWGITAVVSMRTTEIAQFLRVPWLKFLHLPTPDQHAPTLEQLQQGVDFITQEIAAGGSVYIHCHHGEGRGPTMTAAYLMSTGLTLEDALSTIRKVRPFIKPTTEQLEQLAVFAKLSPAVAAAGA